MHQPEMDGFRFAADCIGSSTLSKPTTGVGALQQPIKELYLKFKKPGGAPNAKKVILRVSQSGLSVAPADGAKGEVVHDLNSITHIEAVRFTLISGNDKKMRAIFLPLEESRVPPNKDKSVFNVDKSYQFFKQINHPPLLACVLRRPRGVKSLDCHVFVMENSEDALQVISLINQVESGTYDMEYIGDRPKDAGFNRGQRSDVIRTEYGDYSVYTGSKYELKDDYFRPPEGAGVPLRPQSETVSNEDHDDYTWNYRRVVSMDDGWQRGEGGQYGQEEQYMGNSRPASTFEPSRLGYSYEKPGLIAHQRQGSSGSGETRLNRSFIESSGGRFEENIDRGQHFPSGRTNKSIRNSEIIPPKVADKPPKFENLNRPMPLRPASPQFQQPQRPLSPRALDSPRLESPRSPGTPTSPSYSQPASRNFHPPSSGPSYSMSNRENWNASQKQSPVEEAPQQKPIAKVPPHLMTGVKVLPTDFSAVKLKTRSPKSSFDDDHDYDNNLNVKTKMKAYREEEEIQGRAYHYTDSTGTTGNYKGPQQQQPVYRDENYTTRVHNFSHEHEHYNDDDGRYIEQYDDGYDAKQRQQYDQRLSDNRGGQNRYSSTGYDSPRNNQWQENQGGNERISPLPYDMGGRGPASGRPSSYVGGEGGKPPPKKDAEIASMFTNLHVQRDPPYHYTQGDTNFEQSLGYYP